MANRAGEILVGINENYLADSIKRGFALAERNARPLGKISSDLSQFNKSLDAATSRVLAFSATASGIFLLQRAIQSLVKSTIEVEKSLTDINVILNASQKGLESFGNSLFQIAKDTGQTFREVAKAATELSRQGLSAEETLKRTRDALILTRLSGLDAVKSVTAITTALNTYNRQLIDSTTLVSKLAAVDADFAVSSGDLAEALSRVGSTAQDAGVSLDQLLGIVTAVKQTTGRDGSVIGNSLKTIFTRIQRPEVLDQLEILGVKVKDASNSILPAINILESLAKTYDSLGQAQRSQVGELVGGVYQINILKSALSDLGKQYSITENATRTAAQATDEAIIRNEKLNTTLSAQLNKTIANLTQAGSKIGNQTASPLFTFAFDTINKVLESTINNQNTESIGYSIGTQILSGIGKAFTTTGIFAIGFALTQTFVRVAKDVFEATKAITGLNRSEIERKEITAFITSELARQPQLYELLQQGSIGVLRVQREILATIEQQAALASVVNSTAPLIASGVRSSGFKVKEGQFVKNFADPVRSAIQRELSSGVPLSSIRIGTDSRIGAGVYNTIDEPYGLYQGVNRALKEGKNPNTYGIPNFASDYPTLLQGVNPPLSSETLARQQEDIIRAISQYKQDIKRGVITQESLNDVLSKLKTEFYLTESAVKKIRSQFEQSSRYYESNNAAISKSGLLPSGGVTMAGGGIGFSPINNIYPNTAFRPYTMPSFNQFNQIQSQYGPGIQQTLTAANLARVNQDRELYLIRKSNVEILANRQYNKAGIANYDPLGLKIRTPKPTSAEISAADRELAAAEKSEKARAAQNKLIAASFLIPFLSGAAEKAIFTGENKSDRVGRSVFGGVTTALAGAALGSSFGGHGALIGGLIGGSAGAYDIFKQMSDDLPEFQKRAMEAADALNTLQNNFAELTQTIDLLTNNTTELDAKQKETLDERLRTNLLNYSPEIQSRILDAKNSGDLKELERIREEISKGPTKEKNIKEFSSLIAGKNPKASSAFALLSKIAPETLFKNPEDFFGKGVLRFSHEGDISHTEIGDFPGLLTEPGHYSGFVSLLKQSGLNDEEINKIFENKQLVEDLIRLSIKKVNSTRNTFDAKRLEHSRENFDPKLFSSRLASKLSDISLQQTFALEGRNLRADISGESSLFDIQKQIVLGKNNFSPLALSQLSLDLTNQQTRNAFAAKARGFGTQAQTGISGILGGLFGKIPTPPPRETSELIGFGIENLKRLASGIGSGNPEELKYFKDELKNFKSLAGTNTGVFSIFKSLEPDIEAIETEIKKLENNLNNNNIEESAKLKLNKQINDLKETELELERKRVVNFSKDIYSIESKLADRANIGAAALIKLQGSQARRQQRSDFRLQSLEGILGPSQYNQLQIQEEIKRESEKFSSSKLSLRQKFAESAGNLFQSQVPSDNFNRSTYFYRTSSLFSAISKAQSGDEESIIALKKAMDEFEQDISTINDSGDFQELHKLLIGIKLAYGKLTYGINEQFLSSEEEKKKIRERLGLLNGLPQERVNNARQLFLSGGGSGENLRNEIIKRNEFNLAKNGKLTGGEIFEGFSSNFLFNGRDLFKELNDAAIDLGATMKSSFKDAFKSFADGSKDAKEALRDLGLSLANKLLDKSIDIGFNALFSGVSAGLGAAFGHNSGGLIGYSSGGMVYGGSGVRDDVPAMLNQGDYVLRRSAVNKYGSNFLNGLNSGNILRRAGGGVSILLGNAYDYNDSSRPTSGRFRVNPFLSAFGQTDENNPQNAIKFGREQELQSYIQEKIAYDQNKAATLRAFKQGQTNRLIGAYISAATGIAGAGLSSAYGKPSGVSNNPSATKSSNLYTGQSYYNPPPVSFRANGGIIDNVPALLTGGEFVVRKPIVDKMGVGFFDQLNAGRFAGGGLVGTNGRGNEGVDSVSRMIDLLDSINKTLTKDDKPAGGKKEDSGSVIVNITNNITQTSEGTKSETGQDKDNKNKIDNDSLKKFNEGIKTLVYQTIIREKKDGGLLSPSELRTR